MRTPEHHLPSYPFQIKSHQTVSRPVAAFQPAFRPTNPFLNRSQLTLPEPASRIPGIKLSAILQVPQETQQQSHLVLSQNILARFTTQNRLHRRASQNGLSRRVPRTFSAQRIERHRRRPASQPAIAAQPRHNPRISPKFRHGRAVHRSHLPSHQPAIRQQTHRFATHRNQRTLPLLRRQQEKPTIFHRLHPTSVRPFIPIQFHIPHHCHPRSEMHLLQLRFRNQLLTLTPSARTSENRPILRCNFPMLRRGQTCSQPRPQTLPQNLFRYHHRRVRNHHRLTRTPSHYPFPDRTQSREQLRRPENIPEQLLRALAHQDGGQPRRFQSAQSGRICFTVKELLATQRRHATSIHANSSLGHASAYLRFPGTLRDSLRLNKMAFLRFSDISSAGNRNPFLFRQLVPRMDCTGATYLDTGTRPAQQSGSPPDKSSVKTQGSTREHTTFRPKHFARPGRM
jgi:hypothetical protein